MGAVMRAETTALLSRARPICVSVGGDGFGPDAAN